MALTRYARTPWSGDPDAPKKTGVAGKPLYATDPQNVRTPVATPVATPVVTPKVTAPYANTSVPSGPRVSGLGGLYGSDPEAGRVLPKQPSIDLKALENIYGVADKNSLTNPFSPMNMIVGPNIRWYKGYPINDNISEETRAKIEAEIDARVAAGVKYDPSSGSLFDNKTYSGLIGGSNVDVSTSTGGTSGGGGGTAVSAVNASVEKAFRDALANLNAQMAGVGGTYDERLAAARALAESQTAAQKQLYADQQAKLDAALALAQQLQGQANLQATTSLASIDPQAGQFQWNLAPSVIGGGSAENYLRSIGASNADVQAARDLQQSLLNQSLQSSQQYSAGTSASMERERAARQAAAALAGAEGMRALTGQYGGYAGQLSAGELNALASIQNALFGTESQLATNKQAAIDELTRRILELQLTGAQAGVAL